MLGWHQHITGLIWAYQLPRSNFLIKAMILGAGCLVAFFAKEVNPRLGKRPLKFNGRFANRGLTFLVKEATGGLCASQACIVEFLREVGFFNLI